MGGQNTNSGLAPDAAWRDFSSINGQILHAGDRLLIKCGSVINQELSVGAAGTSNHWVEIGSYGMGARPIIRRNGDIAERCALIKNPDFLHLHGLTFCRAGKGLVINYATPGHQGLLIDNCVAHDITGIYREWTFCNGIPEWRGHTVPVDDGLHASAGIAVTGAGRNITIRDCDLFQTSWGFWVTGENVLLDRVYVHHCYVFNGSPHPALLNLKNSVVQNCLFDVSGYHAFAGTMGLMLAGPQHLTIRNCTFRNQPDSGCTDEGGIDFENGGEDCLIDGCTFENNAGAAIEVLGLVLPQVRHLEIRNSRFIRDNWASQLGPSEIFIWGGDKPDAQVCCSSGLIHDNGCVLFPGVGFFTNQAPASTRWQTAGNRTYATLDSLERAMPAHQPPVVKAGPDVTSNHLTVRLAGAISDDGLPAGRHRLTRWELLDGGGTVNFKHPEAPDGEATFSAPGEYRLRLVGDDGELWMSDLLNVHILPRGVTLARAWEFNQPLDKEGWTESGLGTKKHLETPINGQDGTSRPVKYVAGGCYIIAMEDAPQAGLTSADRLRVGLNQKQIIHLRLQNHTGSTRMMIHFTTVASPDWTEAQSQAFSVTPNDDDFRDYWVNLTKVDGWRGSLKQLRVDLTTGSPATGTIHLDFIRIENWKLPPK